MDRASFLRSLNFLRPLHSSVWDSSTSGDSADQEEEDPYSGSTITPPTPSKNNAIMILQDSLFVVSLEPSVSHGHDDKRGKSSSAETGGHHDDINDIGEAASSSSTKHGAKLMARKKKHDRDDDIMDMPTKSEYNTVGPAFFHTDIDNKIASITQFDHADQTAANQTGARMDIDEDVDCEGEEEEEEEKSDLRRKQHRINSDPSLCTFEAAIIKKLPCMLLGGDTVCSGIGKKKDDGSTPNKHDTSDELSNGLESKILLFRFGGRFVFQANETAILDVKYQAGDSQEEYSSVAKDGLDGNNHKEGHDKEGSPPLKRQRIDEGDGIFIYKVSKAKTKKLPPSLIIKFDSCILRIFSSEDSNTSNGSCNDERPSSRIWETLASAEATAESRLMNARKVLQQQFDQIDNNRETFWSGIFEDSSFHAAASNKSSHLDEKWSSCLGTSRIIECKSKQPSSPQKSSGSSSFEHGQKDKPPSLLTKNGSSSQSQSSKNDANDKNNISTNDASVAHESLRNEEEKEDEDGVDSIPEIQYSMSNGSMSSKLEAKNDDGHTADKETKQSGTCVHHEKKSEEDYTASEDKASDQELWKDRLYESYHQSEMSAIHMEKALKYKENNMSSNFCLTHCAESLASSYLTANELMGASQQCENEIQNTTTEMENVLDTMFPARGKKAVGDTDDHENNEDLQRRMEELVALRREAVASKFALLMTPKRGKKTQLPD